MNQIFKRERANMGELMCESCGKSDEDVELREDPISKSHELYYLCDRCIEEKNKNIRF